MPSLDSSARSQGRGELCHWERGDICQSKLNSMLVVAQIIFFPTFSNETQSPQGSNFMIKTVRVNM